ncbi:MAG: D-alanine--D-alanine ligase [Patescibacteria group bacterium]|nr:D-alanine--D-alanine ligase [Patescibacteria group bacterium]
MNIGVFFGSGSPEHDISIITGELVIGGLKKLGYRVTPVYITKAGKWMVGEELGSLKMFTDPNKKVDQESKFQEYYLDLEESAGKLVFKKKGVMGKSIIVDLVFPALHGSYGEDGTLQGLFEMFGVPYVGCDVPASALAMDKALTKVVMKDAGVPTTKFISFTKADWQADKSKIKNQVIGQLSFPVFIKPVHLGSSIGIAKVKPGDDQDLEFRIEVALHYDNKVLVEEGVQEVMDVTCCVIGNDELQTSALQESVFSNDLFDFSDKYLNEGGAQLGKAQSGLVIPARLDDQTTTAIQEAAKIVYRALGCSGIARVDFLFDKQSRKFYANEVNPLPGTLYHHLWKKSGLELDQLLQKLVQFAEEKYKQKRSVNFTFESDVLKRLNLQKLGKNKLG